MKSKIIPLDPKRPVCLGPIFCEKCGWFFDHIDRDHRSIRLNYDKCSDHRGKEGYSLLEKLRKMERYEKNIK